MTRHISRTRTKTWKAHTTIHISLFSILPNFTSEMKQMESVHSPSRVVHQDAFHTAFWEISRSFTCAIEKKAQSCCNGELLLVNSKLNNSCYPIWIKLTMMRIMNVLMAFWAMSTVNCFTPKIIRSFGQRIQSTLNAGLAVGDAVIAEVDDILGSVSDPKVSFLVSIKHDYFNGWYVYCLCTSTLT